MTLASIRNSRGQDRRFGVGSKEKNYGLTHRRDLLRPNLVDDTHLTRLAQGVFVLIQVLLCQLVNVGIGALLGDLRYFPPHRHMAVRVVRIRNSNPNLFVAPHVFVFDAAFSGVD